MRRSHIIEAHLRAILVHHQKRNGKEAFQLGLDEIKVGSHKSTHIQWQLIPSGKSPHWGIGHTVCAFTNPLENWLIVQ
jgi:hypothetical protein